MKFPFIKKASTKKTKVTKITKQEANSNDNNVVSKRAEHSRIGYFFSKLSSKLKIWFFGLIKEFSRVTWLKGKGLWESYAIVIAIIIILAIVFYIISLITAQI